MHLSRYLARKEINEQLSDIDNDYQLYMESRYQPFYDEWEMPFTPDPDEDLWYFEDLAHPEHSR